VGVSAAHEDDWLRQSYQCRSSNITFLPNTKLTTLIASPCVQFSVCYGVGRYRSCSYYGHADEALHKMNIEACLVYPYKAFNAKLAKLRPAERVTLANIVQDYCMRLT